MSNPQDSGSPWPTYGQGASQQPSSPWPVYGQNSGQPAEQSPQQSADPQNPYAQQSSGWSPQGQTQPSQPTYGQYASPQTQGTSTPQQNPYAQQPQQTGYNPQTPQPAGPFMTAGTQISGQLPSRTGPVLTIIGGIVMMIVIAPIALFTLLLNGVGISQVVEDSMNTTNNGTVTVDDSGAIGVLTTSQSPVSCTVSGAGGTTEMVEEASGAVVVARGLTPGQYTLSCEGLADTDQIVVLSGSSLDRLVPASMTAFGWASAIGVVGFIIMIVGIVWLVKRNKQRMGYLPPQQFRYPQ